MLILVILVAGPKAQQLQSLKVSSDDNLILFYIVNYKSTISVAVTSIHEANAQTKSHVVGRGLLDIVSYKYFRVGSNLRPKHLSLMGTIMVIFFKPQVKIKLKRFNIPIDFPSKCDLIKLLQHCFVEPLADTISLR